jgi:signal transduction histidine kinase
MMIHKVSTVLAAVALVFSVSVHAGEEASPDEAKAMAIRAADYLKASGPEAAFPAFDARDGSWHDRDLFVAVLGADGTMRAHGANPGLIGHNMLNLKDVDGKAFNQDILAVADTGWVTFKWRNLTTHKIEPKTLYVVHVNDNFVMVGAFQR